jgi:hypothetical protein
MLEILYPLWMSHQLAGSNAAGMTFVFALVPLPILAMPWKYAYRRYVTIKG